MPQRTSYTDSGELPNSMYVWSTHSHAKYMMVTGDQRVQENPPSPISLMSPIATSPALLGYQRHLRSSSRQLWYISHHTVCSVRNKQWPLPCPPHHDVPKPY